MAKPSVEKIKEIFKAYEKHYSTLHQDQKGIDEYYELTFDANVPVNYPARVPPTARDWIDVGVRNFTLDNPKAKVYLRNDSDIAREQVSKMETFYNFWLRKDILIIKQAAKKLPLRGEVFLKVNMDDTYFGSDDEERLFHFPLFLTVPDPINVYCSPAHSGLVPKDVVETFKITVAEAEALCEANEWKWKTDKKPNDEVTWFSYISPEWRCFLIEDEPVLPSEVQPNLLGFVPYVHIPAGFGQLSYEGKPEYLYRSLLWSKQDMLKMQVRTLSALDAINARYAWPQRTMILGDIGAQAEIEKLYPGGQIPTDPDKWLYQIKDRAEISIIEGEQPPPGLFQEYALIQSHAAPPEVLAGVRPAGVYSGEHQESLMSTAKPIYKDAFKNLEDGLGIAMGMGARIIEKVYDYPVQIKNFASEDAKTYRQIKPSDIKGHYDCEVQLLAEPPEATDMRKALGKALRQAGSISHLKELRDYEDMSMKEAEDEIAQIAAEMAMQEPAVRAVIAKDAMARHGMDKELEAIEEAEQIQKQEIAGARPPIQQGEGLNMAGVQRRNRATPELGNIQTPVEQEANR